LIGAAAWRPDAGAGGRVWFRRCRNGRVMQSSAGAAWEDFMNAAKSILASAAAAATAAAPAAVVAVAVAVVAVVAAAVSVHAQRGDLISFPADYAKGVMYAVVDRADNKQVRHLYVNSQGAIDAAKAGQPLPNGTVLTMVQYAAQLDDKGNPIKGPDGRFIKTDKIVGYTVMEKRAGWGADVPAEIRNGDWQYQAYTPARAPNSKAVLANCFKCHKPLDKEDFVFSYSRLKAAMKN
jgi:hypothetical protein